MKKLTAILVCSVCITAMVSGCGKKEMEPSLGGSVLSQEVVEQDTVKESEKEVKSMEQPKVPESLNHEFIDRHYGFKFWVSTMNGTYNDAGTSYRFSKNDDDDRADLFLMKYTVDGSYTDAEDFAISKITSSKDIFEAMEGKFTKELTTPGKLDELHYTNLETSMINGVEMTKFEGNFTEKWGGGESYMGFAFVGYQILAKNRPIVVIVVEKEVSMDNSNIQQFYSLVDDIVSTFVDEEGGTKEVGYLE